MKHSIRSLVTLSLASAALGAPLIAQSTIRVSVGPGGVEANGRSDWVDLSANGQVVVFGSLASNLVGGDGNGTWDVFAHDRSIGVTELVSRTPAGTSGAGGSQRPVVSASGRWVLFHSSSSDLVPGGGSGLHLLDRQTDTMSRIQYPSGSGVQGDNYQVSPDGRYVVFDDIAAITPDDTNSFRDIYRWDRVTDTFALVSTDGQGNQNNTSLLLPSVSHGGRYVAFMGTTNTWLGISTPSPQIWRKDLVTGELVLASSLLDGTPASGLCRAPHIAGDGLSVAFETVAGNIPGYPGGTQQIGMKDLVSGECKIVSVNGSNQAASNYCWDPAISEDGRFVTFQTTGNNMAGPAGHYSIYVRDRTANMTLLASVSTGLQAGNDSSTSGSTSITAGATAFKSLANNLVPNDNAGHEDVFLRIAEGPAPKGYGRVVPQSNGCIPTLSWTGTPSMTAGSGFRVELSNVRTQTPGMLIYSRNGASVLPFFGERLYIAAPILRTTPQLAGGSPSGPCNGSYSFDFNAYIAGGGDPFLSAGSRVWAQYWSRDFGGTQGAWLSDAVTFVVTP